MKKDIPITGLITTNCMVVEAAAGFEMVRAIFENTPVQFLPVVKGIRFVGIIFRDEFFQTTGKVAPTAAKLIQKNLPKLAPGSSVQQAKEIFETSDYGLLPIVEKDGDLAGLLLRADFEKAMREKSGKAENVIAR